MRKIMIFVFLFLLVNGKPNFSMAQNLVDKRVEAMHIEELGISGVLREVSKQTNLTIGLEMDLIIGKEKRISFDFHGGTVADLANLCTSLLQGASWRIVDGRSIVISQPGKALLLAELPIEFSGVINATRRQIWFDLMWSDLSNHPEIEGWLRSENCRRLALLGGHEWQGDSQSISIPKGMISLEHLLAVAAESSDVHYWSVLKNTREEQCEIILTLW